VLGRFLSLVRVQNTGIAFSIGDSLPPLARRLLFILLPLAVMGAVVVYLLRSDEPTALQRWALAGIVGGGLGNLVDRIGRADGVVDFVLVRMYGLFGMEFFPVFNLADAAITCSAILLVWSLLRSGDSRREVRSDGNGDTGVQ
jgi:signal peptidase II